MSTWAVMLRHAATEATRPAPAGPCPNCRAQEQKLSLANPLTGMLTQMESHPRPVDEAGEYAPQGPGAQQQKASHPAAVDPGLHCTNNVRPVP